MNSTGSSEVQYRKLFEDPNEQVITLSHLFDALNTSGLTLELEQVLNDKDPITVLIEGSAFPRNLDVVNKVLMPRNNPTDSLIMLDVSDEAVQQHKSHPKNAYQNEVNIIQGDMNQLPVADKSVDIVINDCAINFNCTSEQNKTTLGEIYRVLKEENSIALITVVVARAYDSEEFGTDQELIRANLVSTPKVFQSFKTNSNGQIELIPGTERYSWPVPYYEKLFDEIGFSFEKFDTQEGKTFFPKESGISYRRYVLKKTA